MTDTRRRTFSAWQFLAAFILAGLATASTGIAGATEIIPSLGITKSTDTGAGDAQGFGGLAVRTALLPFLKLEGGIAYRQDSFDGGDLTVRQWPVTASLWVTPFPVVYAGGGVGWYYTTLDYNSSVPVEDSTKNKMGVHLGGGADLPIAPRLGLDLSGRYIFMPKDDSTLQVPTTFDPDFWTLALGLAIRF